MKRATDFTQQAVLVLLEAGFVLDGTTRALVDGGRQRYALPSTEIRVTVGARTVCVYQRVDGGAVLLGEGNYPTKEFDSAKLRAALAGEMKKPRDFNVVVSAMLKALPVEQVELRARLQTLMEKAFFTAPEIMRIRWVELVETFNKAVFGQDPAAWDVSKAPDWARLAGRILAGEVSAP